MTERHRTGRPRTGRPRTGNRGRRAIGLALAALVMVVAAGCGVGESAAPEDIGEGLGADGPSGSGIAPLDPDQFRGEVELVLGFLKASAGAGESAVDRVSRFLNDNGRKSWARPPKDKENDLTVVRVLGTRTEAPQNSRTPVVVDYQIVGTMTERGRLTKLLDPVRRAMTFWVALSPQPDAIQLRIEQIDGAPNGLLISDEGLAEYYWIQPIYFWDDAYASLVPDLRYIPHSLEAGARATRVVQWLIDGPSPMLGAAKPLRSGTASPEAVVKENDVLVVKLNPQAAAGDERAPDRLLYQLQWSLRLNSALPAIRLQIGNDIVRTAAATDTAYLNYNRASWLLAATPQTFDIVEEKVVAAPGAGGGVPTIPLLAAQENRNVVSAAVNRDNSRAALVIRRGDGSRALQILRLGEKNQPTPRLQDFDLGRPAWVPGTQTVLVTAGGRIKAVSATSGKVADIALRGVGDVTGLSVSPDGRRIAFLAEGKVHVAQLGVDADGVTIEPEPQLLLIDASLVALGVAWTSMEWLGIVGTVGGSAPVIYEVTVDGVVATRRELPRGIEPTDIVASPTAPGALTSGDVYVLTAEGAYAEGTAESDLRAPFFGS